MSIGIFYNEMDVYSFSLLPPLSLPFLFFVII
jgi:hypothetical protein